MYALAYTATYNRLFHPIKHIPEQLMALRLQTIRHHFHTSIRTMSSAPPRKFEWLVVVPDFPGILAKRLEVRPEHFAALKAKVDAGDIVMGGAILDEMPADDEPSSLKFAGSSLVVQAASREDAIEILKGDVYTSAGVWDVANAQIWPLKCALRKAL